MIERIILLNHINRFTNRDYQRFGIELFRKNGFLVEVWDMSSILHPDVAKADTSPGSFDYDGLKVFNSKKDAFRRLSGLSDKDFIMTSLYYNLHSLWAYRAMSRSNASYAVRYVNTIPIVIAKKRLRDIIIGLIRWKDLVMKIPSSLLGVMPPKFIICGGEKWPFYKLYHKYPVGRNTALLMAHSLDYDIYLKEKDKISKEENIAVFLDEYVPFHPDKITGGCAGLVNAEKYYSVLNKFFDYVEKETGSKVVIAAHPRSEYVNNQDYFKGRVCIKGKTIDLVRKSRFVLSHCSTALNFANLFYKPVVFMACSEFEKVYKNAYVKEFSKWFGKEPIFIDNAKDIDWGKELVIKRKDYDNYRKCYIKTEYSQDLPVAQIIADRLRSL